MLQIEYSSENNYARLAYKLRNLINFLIIDSATDFNNFDYNVNNTYIIPYLFINHKYEIITGSPFFPLYDNNTNTLYKQWGFPSDNPVKYWWGNFKFFIVKYRKTLYESYKYYIYYNIASSEETGGLLNNCVLLEESTDFDTIQRRTAMLRFLYTNVLQLGQSPDDSFAEEIYNGIIEASGWVNIQDITTIVQNDTLFEDVISINSHYYAGKFIEIDGEIYELGQSPTNSQIEIEITFPQSILEFFVKLINYVKTNYNFIFTIEIDPYIEQAMLLKDNLFNKQSISNISNINFIPYTQDMINTTDELYIISYDYENDIISYNIDYFNTYMPLHKSGITLTFTNIYNDLLTIDLTAIKKIDINYSTIYGISQKINTNLLARDFQTSKQELISFIQTHYPEIWNDFYESNAGMPYLDALSMLYDILHNYVDRNQREQWLSTMLENKNIFKYAYQNGIFIPYGTAATMDIIYEIFQLDVSDLSVNAGDTITLTLSNFRDMTGITQNYQDAQVITVTDKVLSQQWSLGLLASDIQVSAIVLQEHDSNMKYVTVPVYLPYKQGIVQKNDFTLQGVEDEVLTLSLSSVDLSMIKLYLIDNDNANPIIEELSYDTQWDYYNNSIDVIIERKDTSFILNLGNRVIGLYKRKEGQLSQKILRIVYLLHNGEEGNGVPENVWGTQDTIHELIVDVMVNGNSNNIYTDVKMYSKGNSFSRDGVSEFTQKEIKQYIISQQPKNTLVTFDDFVKYTNFYIGKYGNIRLCNPILYKYAELAYDESLSFTGDANVVLLYTWLNHPTQIYAEWNEEHPPSLINEFIEDVRKNTIETLFVIPKSGKIFWYDFIVKLGNVIRYNKENLKTMVSHIIKNFFIEKHERPFYFRISDLIYILNKNLKEKIDSTIYVQDILLKLEGESDYISLLNAGYSSFRSLITPEIIINYDNGNYYNKQIVPIFGEIINNNNQYVSSQAQTIAESIVIPLPRYIDIEIEKYELDRHIYSKEGM